MRDLRREPRNPDPVDALLSHTPSPRRSVVAPRSVVESLPRSGVAGSPDKLVTASPGSVVTGSPSSIVIRLTCDLPVGGT